MADKDLYRETSFPSYGAPEKKIDEDVRVKRSLKDILSLVTVTSKLALEFEEKDLADSIMDVALKVTNTDAGSILLVDEEREELYFAVVKGAKSEKLKDKRFPLGKGIAGYVALHGQPVCVSSVEDDELFDPFISKEIDYETRSILAVPMELSEKVIGVLEVINKGNDRFSKEDIEILSILAKQAAMAISGNRLSNMIYKLFLHIIERTMIEKSYEKNDINTLLIYMKDVIEEHDTSEEYKNLMEMTSLMVQISKFGPLKQEACIDTLKNFKSYILKELETDPFSLSS